MKKLIVFNAESAYYYFTDASFRHSVHGAHRLYCDSASLSLVLRLCSVPHARLHGPDLMDFYLRDNSAGRVMVIGGSSQAHRRIQEKYNLKQAKYIDRQLSAKNVEELGLEVIEFDPHVIFVCLGLRKQEAVADLINRNLGEHYTKTKASIVGVGAAVDFLGETKVRSGPIWQKLGLEWLPRVAREPRMVPRIFRSLIGCFLTVLWMKSFKDNNLIFAKDFND